MDPVSIAICVGIGVYVVDKASNINLSGVKKGISKAMTASSSEEQPETRTKTPKSKVRGPAARR